MIALRHSRLRFQEPRRFILTKVGECLYRSEAGSYFAIVKVHGKQHRQCLKTNDRDTAKTKLAEFRQRLCAPTTDDSPVTEKPALSFGEMAKRWLNAVEVHLKPSTHFRRCGVVKVGLNSFKRKPVTEISRLDCEQWASKRMKQVKARTFNYELETLHLIFKYGIEHGLLSTNPTAGLKRRRLDTSAVVIPSREQFRMLIQQMRVAKGKRGAGHGAITVEFLGYSGARLGEAVSAVWQDVNFEAKTLTITGGERGTKNHHVRTIPLFAPLERLLRDLKASLPCACKPTDRILTTTDCRGGLQTACRRLGLPHYHHHTFRHFFASNCVEAGVDFRAVAGWLGHRDGGALLAKTYSHLRAEHSVEMAKKITFDAGNSH